MIRYTLTLILLFFASCSTVSAATETPIDNTLWLTSGDDVHIFQLPPSSVNCSAVPPLRCEMVDKSIFITLDPTEMPPYSSMYSYVSFDLHGLRHDQLVNCTVWNFPAALAPERSMIFWVFAFVLLFLWKVW